MESLSEEAKESSAGRVLWPVLTIFLISVVTDPQINPTIIKVYATCKESRVR